MPQLSIKGWGFFIHHFKERVYMKYISAIGFSILLAVAESHSGDFPEDTSRVYPINEVVITATRIAKTISDVGKSVTKITPEQINGENYHDLSDLLSRQLGLTVVGDGQNFGANQSIFLRGANSNQTVVMIDNIRITDPSSVNDAPDLSELSFFDVDQVEIVRGLNSTLYGSSSIGGVVNLLTRKQQKNGFNLDAVVEGGTFGSKTSLHRENLFLNYTSASGLYFNGEINNLIVHGLDATVDTITNSFLYNRRDRDNMKQHDYAGKIGFTNESWDVHGSIRRTEQDKDLDKRAYVDDDNYTLDHFRNIYSYGIAYNISPEFDLKALGGFSVMHRNAVDDSSVTDYDGSSDHTFTRDNYRGNSSTNEVQLSVHYPHLETVLGGNYYRESMSANSYYYSWSEYGMSEYDFNLDTLDLHTSTWSIFSRLEINGSIFDGGLSNLTIALGGNLLDHSAFGSQFVYEVNPTFKLSPTSLLYLSIATGFTSPSLYQLYSPVRNDSSGITIGNSRLNPEHSHSFEIGFKEAFGTSLEYSISIFRTVTDDMIQFVYLWDKNIGIDTLGKDWERIDDRGYTYLNLGKQTTQGIEANITSKVNEKVIIDAAVTVLDGTLDYDPSNIDTTVTHDNHVQIYDNGVFLTKHTQSVGLVRRPNSAAISVTYNPINILSLRMNMKYVGRRGDVYYDANLGPYGALGTVPLPDYSIVDISAKVLFNDLLIGLRLENAFNTKYSEIQGFTTRGRGFYASIRYAI
jgi:vitamin B12 transporter